MANPFKLHEVEMKMVQTKRTLPVLLAKQAEKHFTESFSKGGLDEHKWEESKRRIDGEKAYMNKPRGISMQRWHSNPTLVGVTGMLRRKVSNSIRNSTWNNIRLVVDLPYASVHNDGEGKQPERPFMKPTQTLKDMQLKLIKIEIDKIWKV